MSCEVMARNTLNVPRRLCVIRESRSKTRPHASWAKRDSILWWMPNRSGVGNDAQTAHFSRVAVMFPKASYHHAPPYLCLSSLSPKARNHDLLGEPFGSTYRSLSSPWDQQHRLRGSGLLCQDATRRGTQFAGHPGAPVPQVSASPRLVDQAARANHGSMGCGRSCFIALTSVGAIRQYINVGNGIL
jgi:hypothetical protein